MADKTDKPNLAEGAAEAVIAAQVVKPEPVPVPAGVFLTILISLYLIACTVLMVMALVQFWPQPAPAGNTSPLFGNVTYLGVSLSLGAEVQMLLLVIFSGALGSLAHALRSLAWYVGHRNLVRSWLLYYLLLPFTGGTLAGIFYFVIRAGFFSPGASIGDTSPFGFVALGGLVGMFSENAILKLQEVASSLLTTAEKGKDTVKNK